LFRLLSYYSVVSAAVILVTIAILTTGYRQIAVGGMTREAEKHNVIFAHILAKELWPRLAPIIEEFEDSGHDRLRDHQLIEELDRAVFRLARGLPILKVKIFDLQGVTIYSTDDRQIGEDESANSYFLYASRDNQPATKLSHRKSFEGISGEVFHRNVVESYVPVRVKDGSPSAVLELYADVTDLTARIHDTTIYIVAISIVAFAIMYGLLLLVVRRADRVLSAQYANLELKERELNLALEELRRANQAKSEFLAMISHELRTPLNAVIGFSELIREQIFGPLGHEKYREYASDIRDSSHHLLELINDVLDLSAIEAGKRVIQKEHVDIYSVAEECSMFVSGLASEKEIRIDLNLTDSIPPLHADRRSLVQILLNLLSNSVKYTPRGGSVELTAKVVNGSHILRVSDSGVGIPAEQIESLVDPFTQVKNSPYTSQEGIGLGLSIVDSLVKLHDGELGIESQVGQGTTVTVSLPSAGP